MFFSDIKGFPGNLLKWRALDGRHRVSSGECAQPLRRPSIAGAEKAVARAPDQAGLRLFRGARSPKPSNPRQARRASAAFSAPATVRRRRASAAEIYSLRRVIRDERARQRRRRSIAGAEKAGASAPGPGRRRGSAQGQDRVIRRGGGGGRRLPIESLPRVKEYIYIYIIF